MSAEQDRKAQRATMFDASLDATEEREKADRLRDDRGAPGVDAPVADAARREQDEKDALRADRAQVAADREEQDDKAEAREQAHKRADASAHAAEVEARVHDQWLRDTQEADEKARETREAAASSAAREQREKAADREEAALKAAEAGVHAAELDELEGQVADPLAYKRI